MAKNGFVRALMAGALLVCVLLITPVSFADSYARIVRLSDVDGTVDIDRTTGQGFERALLNMPITQGVRLKTGITGRAEVEFENGSIVRMAGDSSVDFTQLSLRSNGEHINEIQVGGGTVYVDYRHKNGDDFRVTIGNRAFDLTKDVRFRMHVDRDQAEVAVFKGEMHFGGGTESAKVKKNETFTLDLNDGAKYSLANGISTLSSDDYDQERTKYVEQYAKNRNYGSPYSYGYSDLNRYGSFFDAPGYGLVWQPAFMGAGWDPYSNGYWCLYPGQGYVWVSSYPWGWTPYRYGQWTFLGGYGWVWRPGGWNQWNTGVVVNNPPPTWHQPVPPGQGSGPTVPVGKPIPPPTRRTIQTEDMNPHRPGRVNPTVDANDGSQAQTDRPTRGAPQATTNNVIPATPTTTMPMAPTTIQTRPEAPTRPEREPRMNSGARENNMNAERSNRSQSAQPTVSQPSAPSRSMAPPSAPPANVQPSHPAPAPAPRSAPSKSSNNFQPHSSGGFHSAGGMSHAASATHSTHGK
jgi:hypothetical protein